MPKKAKKTNKKGSAKAQKDLQQAMQNEAAELTPERMADIAAEISVSPIDNPHKAMFLYSIAQGTFNLSLYERYRELLREYRDRLIQEAEQVQQEIEQLQQQVDQTNQELSEAAVGAAQEIQDYCSHIEQRAEKEIERRSESKKGQEVEDIRKKLNKKK